MGRIPFFVPSYLRPFNSRIDLPEAPVPLGSPLPLLMEAFGLLFFFGRSTKVHSRPWARHKLHGGVWSILQATRGNGGCQQLGSLSMLREEEDMTI